MLRTVVGLLVVSVAAVAAGAELKDAAEALRGKNYPKAVELLDAYLPDHPKDPRAYAMRGRALLELGQFERALADVNKAIKLRPRENYRDLQNRGRAQFHLGKVDEALADLTKAIEGAPNDASHRFWRGVIYLNIGKNQQAFDDLHAAVGLDPNEKCYYMLRGETQMRFGLKFETSQRQVGEQTFVVYTVTVADRDCIQSGIADFERAMALDANFAEPYLARARARRALGDYKQAVADEQAYCRLRPDDAHVLNTTAWQLAVIDDDAVRDGKAALELALKACELTKHEAVRQLDTLAAAQAELGRYRKAVETQEKALALVRQHPEQGFAPQQFEERLKLYRERKPYRTAANELAGPYDGASLPPPEGPAPTAEM